MKLYKVTHINTQLHKTTQKNTTYKSISRHNMILNNVFQKKGIIVCHGLNKRNKKGE